MAFFFLWAGVLRPRNAPALKIMGAGRRRNRAGDSLHGRRGGRCSRGGTNNGGTTLGSGDGFGEKLLAERCAGGGICRIAIGWGSEKMAFARFGAGIVMGRWDASTMTSNSQRGNPLGAVPQRGVVPSRAGACEGALAGDATNTGRRICGKMAWEKI